MALTLPAGAGDLAVHKRGTTGRCLACQDARTETPGRELSVPKRIEWPIVVLTAVTVLGGNVFLLRGSWCGWVMMAGSVLLVVMLTLVIRQRRRGNR